MELQIMHVVGAVYQNSDYGYAWFGHVTAHDSLSTAVHFRALRRVTDAVVGRGDAGWTTTKSGNIPTHVRAAHDGVPQKRLD